MISAARIAPSCLMSVMCFLWSYILCKTVVPFAAVWIAGTHIFIALSVRKYSISFATFLFWLDSDSEFRVQSRKSLYLKQHNIYGIVIYNLTLNYYFLEYVILAPVNCFCSSWSLFPNNFYTFGAASSKLLSYSSTWGPSRRHFRMKFSCRVAVCLSCAGVIRLYPNSVNLIFLYILNSLDNT